MLTTTETNTDRFAGIRTAADLGITTERIFALSLLLHENERSRTCLDRTPASARRVLAVERTFRVVLVTQGDDAGLVMAWRGESIGRPEYVTIGRVLDGAFVDAVTLVERCGLEITSGAVQS